MVLWANLPGTRLEVSRPTMKLAGKPTANDLRRSPRGRERGRDEYAGIENDEQRLLGATGVFELLRAARILTALRTDSSRVSVERT